MFVVLVKGVRWLPKSERNAMGLALGVFLSEIGGDVEGAIGTALGTSKN